MIINNTLIKCLKPLYEYRGKKISDIGDKLTYNDYICLESGINKGDSKLVISYLKKILGYPFYRKPSMIKKLRLLKGLNDTMQKIEVSFYSASKPVDMTAKEAGCGFEEISEKWRHSLRIDAVAKKTGLDVFSIAEKNINEIYSWYALAKAEQSAEAIYSKKINKC